MNNFLKKAEIDKLVISEPIKIEKEWIDYNGHLNAAYYNILFDRAGDKAFEILGLGEKYAKQTNFTIYTGEIHLCYLREIHLKHKMKATAQIIDYDKKRIHVFQHLCHEKEGWIAATNESIALHVDMTGPKVAEFPQHILNNIEKMAQEQKNAETPKNVGSKIGIRHKTK